MATFVFELRAVFKGLYHEICPDSFSFDFPVILCPADSCSVTYYDLLKPIALSFVGNFSQTLQFILCPVYYLRFAHFAWGGALSLNAIEVNVYDYWHASVLQADIATKETLALNNVLESFADSIKNSWVDAFVDSMVLVRSWTRRGSRSHSLSDALNKLFSTMTKLNIELHLTFVPSFHNQADPP